MRVGGDAHRCPWFVALDPAVPMFRILLITLAGGVALSMLAPRASTHAAAPIGVPECRTESSTGNGGVKSDRKRARWREPYTWRRRNPIRHGADGRVILKMRNDW